jgi:hypothetical protein
MTDVTEQKQRHPSRTDDEWDELARGTIVPLLQDGTTMTEVRKRYGQGATIRAALARVGYNTKGQPLELQRITGSRPYILANRVAERRKAGVAWWQVELEAGKPRAELEALLRKHGHEDVVSGRVIKTKEEAPDVD